MKTRSYAGNPSQVLIEQLAALGVRYIFNNTGSVEARFFDALYERSDIHGILGLHEGVVTGMAGGYTQVNKDPAVMLVHLECGLGQTLGQMFNIYSSKLPVVVITYTADTGSGIDRQGWGHYMNHSFGPTYLSAPLVKAGWSVIKPDGVAHAVYRALLTALTPPVGPVHLALHTDMLTGDSMEGNIVAGGFPELRAGYPADSDTEEIVRGLSEAKRPLLYIGDGVWKSGAEPLLNALAERVGARISEGETYRRSIQANHPLACEDSGALDPDYVIAIGIRQQGWSTERTSYNRFPSAQVVAVGPDVENLKNFEGLDRAVVADERRTLERLMEWLDSSQGDDDRFRERRERALAASAADHRKRLDALQSVGPQPGQVRPWMLADELDQALERVGGGIVTSEHFALKNCLGGLQPMRRNLYIPPAGAAEGFGMGAALGAKLAAPSRPVVGLVGDGSAYYADTAFWTAAHHRIPVLYVIPNNGGYGVVTQNFHAGLADGAMVRSAEYAGVVLDRIDLVKVAEGYGVEGREVREEADLQEALDHGLDTVEREGRPLMLNVHLPSALPKGGRQAPPFRFAGNDGAGLRQNRPVS